MIPENLERLAARIYQMAHVPNLSPESATRHIAEVLNTFADMTILDTMRASLEEAAQAAEQSKRQWDVELEDTIAANIRALKDTLVKTVST